MTMATMAQKFVYRLGEAGVFYCINRCLRPSSTFGYGVARAGVPVRLG